MKDYNVINSKYENGVYDTCRNKKDIESLLNLIDKLTSAVIDVPVSSIYSVCEAVLENTKSDFIVDYYRTYGIELDQNDNEAIYDAALSQDCGTYPYVDAIKVVCWMNEEVEN